MNRQKKISTLKNCCKGNGVGVHCCDIRGRSDKYLASLPESAIIAREICYRVVHSCRRLLSKFQSNRTCRFVLTACGNGRICGFFKNGKRAISLMWFLFLERKSDSEIKERLDPMYGDPSPSMATVKNWFNEFQRGRTSFRFLMSHAQVPQKWLPQRITWIKSTISYRQTVDWRCTR